MDEIDKQLLEVIRDYAVDMLVNSYGPLIEEIYD